jgi:hypothetical protein
LFGDHWYIPGSFIRTYSFNQDAGNEWNLAAKITTHNHVVLQNYGTFAAMTAGAGGTYTYSGNGVNSIMFKLAPNMEFQVSLSTTQAGADPRGNVGVDRYDSAVNAVRIYSTPEADGLSSGSYGWAGSAGNVYVAFARGRDLIGNVSLSIRPKQ